MKRKILKKIAVLFLAAIEICFVSCNSENESHKHTFATEWSSDEATHWHAATCEHKDQKKDQTAHTWNHEDYQYDSESGKEIRTCTECSYVDDQEHQHATTAALSKDGTNHWKVCDVCGGNYEINPHSFNGWSEVTPATEEAEGSENRVCNDCGYEETRAIPQLNHTHKFAAEWTAGETTHWHAATCDHDEKSEETAHSTTVELSKDQTNHWKVCDVCEGIFEVTEHNFGQWSEVNPATEEAEGLEKRVCNDCRYEETRAIPQLNHTHKFATEWTAGETTHWHAATCGHNEKSGEAAHSTTAELSKDQINHWKICDVCGGRYEVTAHTEDKGTVTTAPTCTEKGVKTYKCAVCEEVLRTEEISEKGHLNTTGLSKDETGHWKVCDVCGGKYDVTAHTEDEGTVTTVPTCVTKGVRTYKCTVCEEVLRTEEVAALGHTDDTGTITIDPTCVTKGVRTYKCAVCEEVLRTEEIPVLYSSPVDAVTGNAATAGSTYIYFGVFPKTVLPKNSVVTVDKTDSVTMGANTYYKGSDGEYYAKVKENCYGSSGYTYTDKTTVKQRGANSYRYFKVEPVKWKVLTNNYNNTGKALLLAEDILTANEPYYEYNSSSIMRSAESDMNIHPNNYKYSQIRAYLNGLSYYYGVSPTLMEIKKDYTGKGFLQTAFTATAQSKIAETEVDNSAASTTDAGNNITKETVYACANTTDKIFLLSEKEVTTNAYGFGAYNSYGAGNARIRVTTDYAKAKYAYQSTTDGYGGDWWLRSPYYNSGYDACLVNSGGDTSHDDVSDTRHGVVPALCISLE